MPAPSESPQKLSRAQAREAETQLLSACAAELPLYANEPMRGELRARRARWAEKLRSALLEGHELRPETRSKLLEHVRNPRHDSSGRPAAEVLRLDRGLSAADLEALIPHSYSQYASAGELFMHPAMTRERRFGLLCDNQYGAQLREKLPLSSVPLSAEVMQDLFDALDATNLTIRLHEVACSEHCPREVLLQIVSHPSFTAWNKIVHVERVRNVPEVRDKLIAHATTDICLVLLKDQRPEEFAPLVQQASRTWDGEKLVDWLNKHGVFPGCELRFEHVRGLFSYSGLNAARLEKVSRLNPQLLSDLTEEERAQPQAETTPSMRDFRRVREAVVEGTQNVPLLMSLLEDQNPADFAQLAQRLAEVKGGLEPLTKWLEQNALPAGCGIRQETIAAGLSSKSHGIRTAWMRMLHRLPQSSTAQSGASLPLPPSPAPAAPARGIRR